MVGEMKLICKKCNNNTLTWLDPEVNSLNGDMVCDNPECKCVFHGMGDWNNYKPLTKTQAMEFARIQSGCLVYNASGTEFEGSNLSLEEIEMCYSYMEKVWERMLKDNEHTLGSTQAILDYVRNK